MATTTTSKKKLFAVQQNLSTILFEEIEPLPGEKVGLYRVPSKKGCIEFVKLYTGYYKPHIHDEPDTVISVLNGKGTSIVGKQQTPYETGTVILIPKGTPHGFKVKEETILLSVQTKPILNKESGKIDIRY